jgi:hypothetical protein
VQWHLLTTTQFQVVVVWQQSMVGGWKGGAMRPASRGRQCVHGASGRELASGRMMLGSVMKQAATQHGGSAGFKDLEAMHARVAALEAEAKKAPAI